MDDDYKKTVKEEQFETFFENQGYHKSRRLVEVLKHKIMKFDEDFDNPERLYFITQLRDMKKPFKKCFGKDLI